MASRSALSEARFHESVKLGEVLCERSIEPIHCFPSYSVVAFGRAPPNEDPRERKRACLRGESSAVSTSRTASNMVCGLLGVLGRDAPNGGAVAQSFGNQREGRW